MMDEIFAALQEHLEEIGNHSLIYIEGSENSILIEIDGEQFLIPKR